MSLEQFLDTLHGCTFFFFLHFFTNFNKRVLSAKISSCCHSGSGTHHPYFEKKNCPYFLTDFGKIVINFLSSLQVRLTWLTLSWAWRPLEWDVYYNLLSLGGFGLYGDCVCYLLLDTKVPQTWCLNTTYIYCCQVCGCQVSKYDLIGSFAYFSLTRLQATCWSWLWFSLRVTSERGVDCWQLLVSCEPGGLSFWLAVGWGHLLFLVMWAPPLEACSIAACFTH